MITPPDKLKEEVHRKVTHWAIEFDMDIYHVVGVLMVVAMEMWFKSDDVNDWDESEEDDDE